MNISTAGSLLNSKALLDPGSLLKQSGSLTGSGSLFSTSSLLWGLLFGAIGAMYFIYGKKQQRTVPLLSGIALCVFPYFVTNSWIMAIVGILLIALPFVIRS